MVGRIQRAQDRVLEYSGSPGLAGPVLQTTVSRQLIDKRSNIPVDISALVTLLDLSRDAAGEAKDTSTSHGAIMVSRPALRRA